MLKRDRSFGIEKMGIEKEGSKSGGGYVGGFFQLFDWTAKSRKKLFSSKSDLPGISFSFLTSYIFMYRLVSSMVGYGFANDSASSDSL